MRFSGFSTEDLPEIMGVRKAAECLGIHGNTLRKWIDKGRLKAAKVGGEIGIAKFEVLRILDDGRRRTGTWSSITLLQVNDAMQPIADLIGIDVDRVESEFHALEDLRHLEIVVLKGHQLIDYMAGSKEKPLEARLFVASEEPLAMMGQILKGFLIGRPVMKCFNCGYNVHQIHGCACAVEINREPDHAGPYVIRYRRYKCRACDGAGHVILPYIAP